MVLVSNYKHIPLDFCCICISSFVVFVFLFKQNIFVPKLHLYLFFLFLRHDKFVLKVRVSHISIWLNWPPGPARVSFFLMSRPGQLG